MEDHKRGLPHNVIGHISMDKFTDVSDFLLVYLLLHITNVNTIIRVTAMIVIARSPKNNMYIVKIKLFSIISLTSFIRRQTTSAYSHFLYGQLYNFFDKIAIYFVKKFSSFFDKNNLPILKLISLIYYINHFYLIYSLSYASKLQINCLK